MRRCPLLFALTAALLTACAHVPPSGELDGARQVVIGDAAFVITYAPVDAAMANEVAQALEAAVPRVRRWGHFEAPVFIRIHPTHDALEAAVRRFDYPWLRAWARYDTIDLQSPRTWGLGPAPTSQVVELLTHELTHCLMYQNAGTRSNWMYKNIPLWFREGMASVTARQGYRRATDEEIWRWMRNTPNLDPVSDADSLYQKESAVVYGAAHRAFEFLVSRYGDAAVGAIMDGMKAGASFESAFVKTTDVNEAAFEREYIRYVQWEGWRGPAIKRSRPLVSPVPVRPTPRLSTPERPTPHS